MRVFLSMQPKANLRLFASGPSSLEESVIAICNRKQTFHLPKRVNKLTGKSIRLWLGSDSEKKFAGRGRHSIKTKVIAKVIAIERQVR